jgi:hypothetical protein
MRGPSMADVFICHVEEDEALATALAEGLEASGVTTWYYERDSNPGPSYLLQTGEAIDSCTAMVLVISSKALSRPRQMHTEIYQGFEKEKAFVPILTDITLIEFQQRQPEWSRMVASATAVRVPEIGVSAIMPRLLRGLRDLGIAAGSAARALHRLFPEEVERTQKEARTTVRRQREEAERQQREEAERQQREEAERQQREEAERQQREEAERQQREEATKSGSKLRFHLSTRARMLGAVGVGVIIISLLVIAIGGESANRPLLDDAVLSGTWNVRVEVRRVDGSAYMGENTLFLFEGPQPGDSRTDHWTMESNCIDEPCATSWDSRETPNRFTTLGRDGGTYTATKTGSLPCHEELVPYRRHIELRVINAEAIAGVWTATEVEGEIIVSWKCDGENVGGILDVSGVSDLQ